MLSRTRIALVLAVFMISLGVGGGLLIRHRSVHDSNQPKSLPLRLSQGSSSNGEGDIQSSGSRSNASSEADAAAMPPLTNYLRIKCFPEHATRSGFSVALADDLTVTASDGTSNLRLSQLFEAPVALVVKDPLPERVAFQLWHDMVDEVVYSGQAAAREEGLCRYWDIVIPAVAASITIDLPDVEGTVEIGFYGSPKWRDGNYPFGGEIACRVERCTTMTAWLLPWTYWLGGNDLDVKWPDPPSDRPSYLETQFEFDSDSVDLRFGRYVRIGLTITRVETWRPINTLGRRVTAAYVRDGIGHGSVIPYEDDGPHEISLEQVSRPSDNERYEGRRVLYHQSGDWAVTVSGDVWFREPESWHTPSIAVLEFEDGGFSIVRRTEPLGEDVTELVVPGTPGDGGTVEFKVSAPDHAEGLSLECHVRLPQWEADEIFYYIKDVALPSNGTSTIRIPYGAELWITEFNFSKEANLEVVEPKRDARRRSSRWRQPFRAGDTATIKLADRNG